jgi:hypothetical protein
MSHTFSGDGTGGFCKRINNTLAQPNCPCVSFAGLKVVADLAAAGCAAQVILPTDDCCKEAPTLLAQVKVHRLSDSAIQPLKRLTSSANVGTNAEWLKLQPWTSAPKGEDWEETSRPWAGPREGKRVELQQLLEGLCIDVKAAAQADRPAQLLSAFSLPPSQNYLTPPDIALLRSSLPQLHAAALCGG